MSERGRQILYKVSSLSCSPFNAVDFSMYKATKHEYMINEIDLCCYSHEIQFCEERPSMRYRSVEDDLRAH
jgi:hypothetical protein